MGKGLGKKIDFKCFPLTASSVDDSLDMICRIIWKICPFEQRVGVQSPWWEGRGQKLRCKRTAATEAAPRHELLHQLKQHKQENCSTKQHQGRNNWSTKATRARELQLHKEKAGITAAMKQHEQDEGRNYWCCTKATPAREVLLPGIPAIHRKITFCRSMVALITVRIGQLWEDFRAIHNWRYSFVEKE